MPNSVRAGDEFTVTVRVSKGDLAGFAKFTQELPKGITASVVDGADATFSFKDNKVKFIWVSLPAQSEFSFSYKILVGSQVSGSHRIGGVFAYIFENEKQEAELEAVNLNVGDEDIAAAPQEEMAKGYIEEEITEVKCKRTTFRDSRYGEYL